MPGRDPDDARTASLLAIGRRLLVQYEKVHEPVPPRLQALVEELNKELDDRLQRRGFRGPA
jgi:hypothetical protein